MLEKDRMQYDNILYQITNEWNKTDKANYMSAFHLENLYASSLFDLFHKRGRTYLFWCISSDNVS